MADDLTGPPQPDPPGREQPLGESADEALDFEATRVEVAEAQEGAAADLVTALVPRSLSEILGAAMELYRRNLRLFVTVAAVVYLPWALLEVVARIGAGNDAKAVERVILPLTALSVPLLFMVQGAMIRAISDVYLRNAVSLRECYRYVKGRLGAFIGTCILAGLMCVGLGAVLAVAVTGSLFGTMEIEGGMAILIGLIALAITIAAGILLIAISFWITFLGETVLLEGLGGMDAIRRGRELAAGQWGRIFCLGLVTGLIAIPLQLPTIVIAFAGGGVLATGVFQSIWGGIATSLILPFTLGAQILLYYDIRIRKEAFDLDMLAKSMVSFGAD